jgi:transcriptional regulator with XRE-family HTH domain
MTEKEDTIQLYGTNLRAIRKAYKESLAELASITGTSKSSISDYEKGKTMPSFAFLEAFCSHYRIPVGRLKQADLTSKIKSEGIQALQHEADLSSGALNADRKTILEQRLDGLEVQLKLLHQINLAREAENKTLKVQIQLLQDRLKKYE